MDTPDNSETQLPDASVPSQDHLDPVKTVDSHILKDRSGVQALLGSFAVSSMFKRFRDNAGWSIALIAILVVVNRVLWVSHGSSTTALGIVATTSKSTILFGIAVQVFPYITVAVFATCTGLLVNRISARIRIRTFHHFARQPLSIAYVFDPGVNWLIVLLFVVMIISFTLLPWWLWLFYFIALLVGAINAFFSLRRWHENMRTIFESEKGGDQEWRALEAFHRIYDIGVSLFLGQILLVVFFVIFSSTMWLPTDNFHLANGRTDIGYSLADSGGSRTVLLDQSRLIVTISNHLIVSEIACNSSGGTTTMANLFGLTSKDRNPPCPSAPKKGSAQVKSHKLKKVLTEAPT